MLTRLRRYVRQKTLPIKPEVAWAWKTKLSILYAFLGWQVIGLTVYMILRDKMNGKTSSADYLKLLGVTNARVITFSNIQKTDEYDLIVKEEELDEFHNDIKRREEEQEKTCMPKGGFWNRRWLDGNTA